MKEMSGHTRLVVFSIILGLTTYLGTIAFGTLSQMGLINTHNLHWVHHVFFALVWFTLGGVLITSWGKPWFPVMIVTASCMLIMPRLRGGTLIHRTNGMVGLAAYLISFVWVLIASFN